MTTTDRRKQSLYFPTPMLLDVEAEARRLDRSMSWVIQFSWENGVAALRALPSLPGRAP